MFQNNAFHVIPVSDCPPLTVSVCGSKSITNRALLLAALSDGTCVLENFLFSEDSRALLDAFCTLGVDISANEEKREVTVKGCSGVFPNSSTVLNVHKAGTAARFLTALLAFTEGSFELTCDEQMKKRPMLPLFQALRENGFQINETEQAGFLPAHFTNSKRSSPDPISFEICVDKSSQFLSALLLTGGLLPGGLTVTVTGNRRALSYVTMTEQLLTAFSLPFQKYYDEYQRLTYRILPVNKRPAVRYRIEPDLSGACYFYAAAPLLGTSVTVKGVHPNSCQGDYRFISVLESLGCKITDTPDGICVSGPASRHYPGADLSMEDFSDQSLTMAVLALFADSPTHIRNISHIRGQECDRMAALCNEITRLGGKICEDEDKTGLIITPAPLKGTVIQTYEDHRMAMAFSLAGLRVPGVIIANPLCCKKTFENYFELFSECFESIRTVV